MWNAYDHIVAVSDDCKRNFICVYPNLSEKVIVIENALSKSYIYSEADKYVPEEFDDECINILSIGRFCTAKNFDNVPYICKAILDKEIKVKWFLIGFGGDESLIQKNILDAGVDKNVIILGKRENPYPYIKACDIYIQPSRYEGKSVTVREAQILQKPVIITDFETSSSQLENGVDGIIVPLNNDACAEGIADLIRDKELQKELIKNTNKNDYTNFNEFSKIYELIGR